MAELMKATNQLNIFFQTLLPTGSPGRPKFTGFFFPKKMHSLYGFVHTVRVKMYGFVRLKRKKS